MQSYNNCGCSCRETKDPLNSLPLAMGYVPWQSFHHTFELYRALQIGTIFPELSKPFCGNGKERRCGCQ